jgi:hypothetical protein
MKTRWIVPIVAVVAVGAALAWPDPQTAPDVERRILAETGESVDLKTVTLDIEGMT